MHIVGRMLNVHADEYSTQHRTRACYILCQSFPTSADPRSTQVDYLVHDDQSLCLAASDRGCLESVAALVREITPPEAVEEWGEDEAESLSALREVHLNLFSLSTILAQFITGCTDINSQLVPFEPRNPPVRCRRAQSPPFCQVLPPSQALRRALRGLSVYSGIKPVRASVEDEPCRQRHWIGSYEDCYARARRE